MSKIALINCYFGKWPNYFDLWLHTASYNKGFDFIFITDIKDSRNYPENVKIINMSFEKLVKRIQSHFDFTISLEKPYKLCEYRPAYGLIFENELKDYSWWGYFDVDTVLGDLSTFITEDLLKKYDRIYEQGHLQFYRNNQKMRTLFLTDKKLPCENYKEAFTTKRACHFDEAGPGAYSKELGFNYYKSPADMADIDASVFRFKCFAVKDKDYPQMVIAWKKGKLYAAYTSEDKVYYQEIEYAHFQKRKMENLVDTTKIDDGFIAIPNKLIPMEKITADFIRDNSPLNYNYKEYKKLRRKELTKKLFSLDEITTKAKRILKIKK